MNSATCLRKALLHSSLFLIQLEQGLSLLDRRAIFYRLLSEKCLKCAFKIVKVIGNHINSFETFLRKLTSRLRVVETPRAPIGNDAKLSRYISIIVSELLLDLCEVKNASGSFHFEKDGRGLLLQE